MRGFRRTTKALALALAPLTAVMGVARADNLQGGDAVATGGDASKTPGATGTARFELVANGSDGCNASVSAPVSAAVRSDQTWLTIDAPASVSITACGSGGARTIGYRVSAAAPVGGTATVSGVASGGRSGNNGFNNNPGKFTVTVVAPADSTPPVLSLPADSTAEATSAAGAVVTYSASANDAVDGPVAPSCAPPSGATFPAGQTTVSCTATDAAGNTSSGTFKVTVVDTTAPAVSVPGAITAEATSAAGRAVAFSASALDAVDGALAATCTPSSGAVFPLGATTVSCTATDGAGNTGAASFAVTVQDTTGPQLTLPSGVAAEATGPDGAAATWTATATDAVDGAVAVSCDPAAGATFPLGATTVTCSATDDAGNQSTGSFDVTVADTTAPDLDLPTGIVAEATGPGGAVVTFSAEAADAVAGAVAADCEPPSGGTFAIATTGVSCSARDGAGNTATGGFDVTVRDTTPPSLVAPDGLSAEATSAGGAAVTFAVSASDVVDGTVGVTCSTPSGSTFPLGRTEVTCTATDEAGNTGRATFPVDVVDTTAPGLSVPAAVVVEAASAAGATAGWDASATDLVDGPVTPVCTPPSGTSFAIGTTTVECTATDEAGNQAAASFPVTVRDTTAPDLTVPDDIVAEATGPDGAGVSFSATATDLVDGPVTPVCVPASGATFALGTTTVGCTATDARGNGASGSFAVTVVDTTPPAVVVPGDIEAEATSAGGAAVTYAASATDLVDGAVEVDCAPASDSTFPLGATEVACSAEDGAGNVGRGGFTVTVRDTTPPSLSLPSDFTVEATGPAGATATYEATAADIVDGPVAVDCTPASDSTFPLGANEVACSAEDGAGNVGRGGFTLTVADRTPPGLHLPADVVTEATGPAGAEVNYTATATDLVDGPVTPACAPASGTTFAIDTTTVNCSAADTRGNTDTGTFLVTVRDTTAPELTLPGDMTVEATGPAGAAVTFAATATDIVDGAVEVSCTRASGATFALGTSTVSCTATDAHGNTGAGSFKVTVVDTTAPSLTIPDGIGAEATGPGGAEVAWTATATDLVDGAVAVTCAPASGSTFALGTTTVDCSAADRRGNDVAGSFTVEVVDTTAPVVLVSDVRTTATGNSKAKVDYTASAADVVDGPLVPTCAPTSGSEFAVGLTTVSCHATDRHGNTGNDTATIEVTYDFRGFYRPVDNPTVLNQVKAGQAIPVKFGLAGYQGMAIFAAGHPASGRIECSSAAPVDPVDQTVTAGSSSLSYDSGTGSYHYVWKTDKAWGGTCRRLVLKTADGVTHEALFTFTR